MPTKFVCPICEERNVTFSGVTAPVFIRSTLEWMGLFVCGKSHAFSLPWKHVAETLEVKSTRRASFRDVSNSILRAKRELERSKVIRDRILTYRVQRNFRRTWTVEVLV